jgi:hypothetical protein
MSWKPIKNCKDISGEFYLTKPLVYGWAGSRYPRLVISISKLDVGEVCIQKKNGPGQWWERYPLPTELVLDVAKMVMDSGLKFRQG